VPYAEFAIDTARACHAAGIRTVAVTAGSICPPARREFFRHIDAANVDLKGFTRGFYRRLCLADLQPVLDTLAYLRRETEVWLEVTTLLIPGENDSDDELQRAADWFAGCLGPDVPWHFTAFRPHFKMLETPATPLATLQRARAIALERGLHFVYTGNLHDPEGATTFCPRCAAPVILRNARHVVAWHLDERGRCRTCAARLPGRLDSLG
jgi:pyruvate formate lyase activating enzyme